MDVWICGGVFFFLMFRRPPRSTRGRASAASDVYKRQGCGGAVLGACSGGNSDGSASNANTHPDGGASEASADGALPVDGAEGSVFDVTSSDAHDITIYPKDPVITVSTGQPIPSLTFEARVNDKSVTALWLVDRGEIGLIDVHSGVFEPGGAIAGVAKVVATVGTVSYTHLKMPTNHSV